MLKRFACSIVIVGLCVLSCVTAGAEDKAKFPGPDDGGFLLPNGWRVTPVGDQVLLTDLPLNIVVTPDGKHALVTTNGYNAHEISLIDLATKQRIDKATVPQSWFGVAECEAAAAVVVGGRRIVVEFIRLRGREAQGRAAAQAGEAG